MCGIVGVLRFDGRPMDSRVLAGMIEALSHRGPEATGAEFLTGGSIRIALGHTRLKIIDLSDAASQPMTNEDESVWVTFNGEIYNFREIRSSLEGRGVEFRTTSDTEVILRLYEAEGERCVDTLDGMFAFGVWDARRRTLLLARDRMGKKPLFYYTTPTVFAFASEIKALFRDPEIVAEVDAEMLPAFFLYGYVPGSDTLYRGIRKLPPGHLLRVNQRGDVRVEEYWDVPIPPVLSESTPPDSEVAERVRELVTEAVQKRLIADVPIGVFLSGGLDSTVVTGVMGQLRREPVRTFSIGFAGDASFDETRYARLASQRFGTVHTEFVVRPSAVDLVERLVWHHDGPFADSSAIPTYLLSQLAREHVTVALNGDGGDELFCGYRELYIAHLPEYVPAWVRHLGRRLFHGVPDLGGYRNPLRRLQGFADRAALPLPQRFAQSTAIFYEDLYRLLLGRRRSSTAPEPVALLDPLLQRCKGASSLGQLLYLNVKTYLLDDLLVKMDRCSMAHALETRSPLLDRNLVEYVFGLPDRMKLQGWRTKVIFRRAFADLVPPEILQRKKMGFGVPLRAWFKSDLREYVGDLLLTADARSGEYLDTGYVKELYRSHLSGQGDHSHRLWTLLTFEVWLRSLPRWSTVLAKDLPTTPEGLLA